MKTRIITGAVSVCLLAVLLIFRGVVLDIAVLAAEILAVWEMLNAFEKGGHKPPKIAVLCGTVLTVPAVWAFGTSGIAAVTVLSVIGIMVEMTLRKEPAWEDAVGAFCSAVLQMPFGFMMCLSHVEPERLGLMLFIGAFAIALMGDTLAYFGGSFFGKHKMNPVLSPKKTWEGSASGLMGSMLAALILGLIAGEMPVWHWLILGVIGGIAGQMGDLLASMVKRHNGIKDYGKLFPGHGGMMDRLDSVLLTGSVLFSYVLIAGLI